MRCPVNKAPGGAVYQITRLRRHVDGGRHMKARSAMLAVALGLFLTGCVSAPPPEPAVVVQPPPAPAVRVEAPPPQPGPAYVWVGGHWAWRRRAYVWVPGYWAVPVAPTRQWVAGHWAP